MVDLFYICVLIHIFQCFNSTLISENKNREMCNFSLCFIKNEHLFYWRNHFPRFFCHFLFKISRHFRSTSAFDRHSIITNAFLCDSSFNMNNKLPFISASFHSIFRHHFSFSHFPAMFSITNRCPGRQRRRQSRRCARG